jgi:hypothetical protein
MKTSLTIVSVFLFMSTVSAQVKMKPEPLFGAKLGTPKVADGSMDEWSALGYPGGHGTVENEWYFYDSGYSYWKIPQGSDYDEPLTILVMEPHPWYGQPTYVASGFNLWGAYLCYEPFLDGHSITVALDLPCSSNLEVSPEYYHPYSGIPPKCVYFFPVAFDADGNGNPYTVNNDDYYPGAENGYNYIKPGFIYDEKDQENYRIAFYLGDDAFPAKRSGQRPPGGTNGLIIIVNIASEFGVILPPTAYIPGFQTKSGEDLDLVTTYGADVLEVGGHDNPNPKPGATPRIVDIEVKLNHLKTIIEDPTYIDWSKVPAGKISVNDLNKIYLTVKSGSLDDKSDEHLVEGGHVFPAYPISNVK